MSSVGMDGLLDIDWDAPFDFESFINFAAQDDDQGDQAGYTRRCTENDPLEDTEQRQGLQMVKDIDDSGFAGDRSPNPLTIDALVGDATLPEETLQNHGYQQYPSTLPSAPSSYKSGLCTCFDCLKITQYWSQLVKMGMRPSRTVQCRIPGCSMTNKEALWCDSEELRQMCNHEKGHFMEKRPDSSLVCTEAYCKFTTKRESDFKRHYRSIHCSKPRIFSCPVPWCKYSGDDGFRRKDKLTSHYKNIHQGNLGRDQPLRALQPATHAFPASENETGGAYGSGFGLTGSATQEQDHVL